jgi:predicted nucleic acid-binding protein
VSKSVFVDTSGWLAAASDRETHHAEAAAAYDDLVQRRARLVTTNLVVAEMHILTVRAQNAAAGCELLDAIYADPLYTVVTVTRELESDATDRWLRRYQDQPFSLADAVSFEVMRRERIEEALALDHHFAVAGYKLLPGRPRTSTRTSSPSRPKRGRPKTR